VKACKEEIVDQKCFKETVSVKDRKVKLSQVLLCLENAMHQGKLHLNKYLIDLIETKNEICRN